MAEKEKEQEQDLDLDTEKSGKSKTNLLIIILIVVILVVGGGVAAIFLLPDDKKDDGKGEHEKADVAESHPAAIYLPIHKTFIINFEDTRKARYVQIELALMSRNQHSIDLAQEHSPVIRNNFITILSSQNYDELNTREGKEKLNHELLKSINSTISAEVASSAATPATGEEEQQHVPAPVDAKHSYIEAIYFTSFVMQ